MFLGTLEYGDVYPGLATSEMPAPDRKTTDQKTNPNDLQPGQMKYGTAWFFGIAVLLVALWWLMKGE